MSFRLVQELAADGVLVAVACRVLRVSTSGYYEWRGRAAVGAGAGRRGAQRPDRRDPRHVAWDLRRAARRTPSCGSGVACAVVASGWRG